MCVQLSNSLRRGRRGRPGLERATTGRAGTAGGGRAHATRLDLEPWGAEGTSTPRHPPYAVGQPRGRHHARQQTFRRFSNGWSCSWSGSRVSSEYTTPTRSHSRNHALRSVNGSSRMLVASPRGRYVSSSLVLVRSRLEKIRSPHGEGDRDGDPTLRGC